MSITEANTGTTVALNNDWLNTSASVSNCLACLAPYTYTPTWTTCVYPYPSGKVRLTMTDIERLRTRAKKDKQLRDILAKFTDAIEVVVDFGEVT